MMVAAFHPRRPSSAETRAAFLEAVHLVEAVNVIRTRLRQMAGYLRAHNVQERDIALALGSRLPIELYWLLEEALGAPPAETLGLQAGRA